MKYCATEYGILLVDLKLFRISNIESQNLPNPIKGKKKKNILGERIYEVLTTVVRPKDYKNFRRPFTNPAN